jgi:hypothetical protein
LNIVLVNSQDLSRLLSLKMEPRNSLLISKEKVGASTFHVRYALM